MPKIAVVIPQFGLVGGAEQFACHLTHQMTAYGYDFHVFAHSWKPIAGNVNFHPTGRIPFPRFLITPSFAWYARRNLKKEKWSLVHSHDRVFEADIFTLHGVPHRFWAQEVRGKKVLSLFDRATIWVERQMVKENKKSFFVCVSELTKSIFLEEYTIDSARLLVIHPGVKVDPDFKAKKAQARSYLHYKYGIGKKERIIFFSSMNFEIKGLPEIISALKALKKREQAFKLLVAGKGNWKRYEMLTGKAGIGNNVIFAGVLKRDELTQHYLGSDLYLMLSRFDTFGLVVLEAMACGLPVIISARVGAKDLIEEGKNGFIIADPSDAEAVAAKILHLFPEEHLAPMSEAAFLTARQYTWQETARKYHDLYQRILSARP
ncbi:MAG TPA: glycosyltransferase family 4 protein [Syntrophales bacterium]|nr:glycosyltransferase family 4 protein [Syntrophales bacterium]HPO35671.1 glycosyltransferase family 4 protein [Syntrophales bacterium]